MTDREKVRLCQQIIQDFWGYFTTEEDESGFRTALNCISTVLDFDKKTRGGQGNG